MAISNLGNNSPLSLALQYLKSNDLQSSIKTLGISNTQAIEMNFTECMMSLEQGLNLLTSGHHSQSIAPLRKAMPLIAITNDEDAKTIIPILADFAEGISLLLQGNAHDAAKLLRISSDSIQRLNFFIPGLERMLLSFKAAAELAVTKTHMHVGNMTEVESAFGKVVQIHDELLSKLDESKIEDMPYFSEVFGTRVEFSLLFMRLDLEALDFEALEKRVNLIKEDLEKLSKFLAKSSQSPIKSTLEIIQTLHLIFEIYSRAGKTIFINRHPLKEAEIEELLVADRKIFEAHQKANNAGDRGKMFLYTINQLKRVNDNLLTAGKVKKATLED
ncbi:hypothetical protein ACS8E6_09735 [Salinicola halophyticus]|uniref:hypothetical protein n=1 Tax=Salinicola halophyticus TaxID=1808881 RepID=UPI003F472811